MSAFGQKRTFATSKNIDHREWPQGFPKYYEFTAGALSNMYRHIGDAVPPPISHP